MVRRISNMNTDYGFQLFGTLKSLRQNQSELAFCEVRSEFEEKLPRINYSLLASLAIQEQRCEPRLFRWGRLGLGIVATSRSPHYSH